MIEKMTATEYRKRAEAIIAALEPDERYAANRAFHAIAGRVWTDQEIVGIAAHARVSGYTFGRSAKATAGWIALRQDVAGESARTQPSLLDMAVASQDRSGGAQ